ncbi:hypothetical protein [Caldisalinibacter kiritimatiensis]|uniref:Uncharacterized protein n=1 Tax=Caldisalinibacter kiritimatiensis TaxID=1304284 RepID=R1ASF7_9FIRM|nr:hypothetical protein [Caldisalinibacter kiritimatiensis]EOD00073.1 hypothetical protein L21TH_1883 [Caldisalinibacter kiritimatiensis]
MDNNHKDKKVTPGRFAFLSVGWWIVHIILIALVFFVLMRIF